VPWVVEMSAIGRHNSAYAQRPDNAYQRNGGHHPHRPPLVTGVTLKCSPVRICPRSFPPAVGPWSQPPVMPVDGMPGHAYDPGCRCRTKVSVSRHFATLHAAPVPVAGSVGGQVVGHRPRS
jgi:hypothetical protein